MASVLEAMQMGAGLADQISARRRQSTMERLMSSVGSSIAGGDYQGGASQLLRSGDIQGGLAIQQAGQQQAQWDDAQKQRIGQASFRALSALREMPAQVRSRAAPEFASALTQLGVSPKDINLNQLDDATLDAQLAALAPHYGPTPEYGFEGGVPYTRRGSAVEYGPARPRTEAEIADDAINAGTLDVSRGRLGLDTRKFEAEQGGASAVEEGRRFEQAAAQGTIVIDAIDRALEQVGPLSAGVMGRSALLGGTPAADLAATIDTIEANVGFDYLQQMRDNSKTGGALGQVSERELVLLQATMGSVRQSQSPQQLRDALGRLRQQIIDSKQRVRLAYIEDYGQEPPDAGFFANATRDEEPGQQGPQIGDVEDGYQYLGGDPGDQNSWARVR